MKTLKVYLKENVVLTVDVLDEDVDKIDSDLSNNAYKAVVHNLANIRFKSSKLIAWTFISGL